MSHSHIAFLDVHLYRSIDRSCLCTVWFCRDIRKKLSLSVAGRGRAEIHFGFFKICNLFFCNYITKLIRVFFLKVLCKLRRQLSWFCIIHHLCFGLVCVFTSVCAPPLPNCATDWQKEPRLPPSDHYFCYNWKKHHNSTERQEKHTLGGVAAFEDGLLFLWAEIRSQSWPLTRMGFNFNGKQQLLPSFKGMSI